jgi:hypothetical protein
MKRKTPRRKPRTAAPRQQAGAKRRARTPVVHAVEPGPESVDLLPAAPPVLGNIPWGYGENRVTGMARDPYWIFVYWELTDDAIARARAELEAPDAECSLRVYDTTYQLFDGTNANWSMDVAIYRPANNHYVHVGRPGSTFHVDIGVKSRDGRLATITRSGPVETPRDSISFDTRVEWMTVGAEGAPPPAYEHRFAPRHGAPTPEVWMPGGSELERITQALVGAGWSRTEWAESEMGGRIVRWLRTAVPGAVRVEILFEGAREMIRTVDGVRTVLGPWRVTIYQVGPEGARRVIDRWTVHYSWPVGGGVARVETLPILERILSGYRVAVAASGSEARLLAESLASEALHLGASEWRWPGASELRLLGASEVLFLGASELGLRGASELSFFGASELARLRASESLALGASEAFGGGASEWPLPSSGTRP